MLTAAVSDMILPTHTQQPPTPPHPILVLLACLDGGAVYSVTVVTNGLWPFDWKRIDLFLLWLFIRMKSADIFAYVMTTQVSWPYGHWGLLGLLICIKERLGSQQDLNYELINRLWYDPRRRRKSFHPKIDTTVPLFSVECVGSGTHWFLCYFLRTIMFHISRPLLQYFTSRIHPNNVATEQYFYNRFTQTGDSPKVCCMSGRFLYCFNDQFCSILCVIKSTGILM